MKCCKGKLKGFIRFVWGNPWPSHHPTPSKKDSNPVYLPKLSESYTDHSIIWKISFWRWTNWHPQKRGFLSRGKLGFTYGAHFKGMLCYQVPCWITFYVSSPCSVNKKCIHFFTSVCKDCWYSLAITLLHVCKKTPVYV